MSILILISAPKSSFSSEQTLDVFTFYFRLKHESLQRYQTNHTMHEFKHRSSQIPFTLSLCLVLIVLGIVIVILRKYYFNKIKEIGQLNHILFCFMLTIYNALIYNRMIVTILYIVIIIIAIM